MNIWCKDELSILKNNYNKMKTIDLLKLLPKRSLISIKQMIWKNKLFLKGRNRRMYNLEKLLGNTNETYYWIGFLLADGHFNKKNNRIHLSIHKKDIVQIQRFSDFIEGKCVIKNDRNCVLVAASNKQIVPLIKQKFDINNNKSHIPPNIEIFKKMEDELFLSLLIGYIDGDGNITNQSRNKTKTYGVIRIKSHSAWFDIFKYFEERLYQIFQINHHKYFTRIDKQGYCSLIFSNSIIGKTLKKFIITNKLPAMERKWNIILP